jgi:hypothetical protein
MGVWQKIYNKISLNLVFDADGNCLDVDWIVLSGRNPPIFPSMTNSIMAFRAFDDLRQFTLISLRNFAIIKELLGLISAPTIGYGRKSINGFVL